MLKKKQDPQLKKLFKEPKEIGMMTTPPTNFRHDDNKGDPPSNNGLRVDCPIEED